MRILQTANPGTFVLPNMSMVANLDDVLPKYVDTYARGKKHNWYEKADPALIVKSAKKISAMPALLNRVVVMPRPGCGNGSLKWTDVRDLLAPILDHRFHVISPMPKDVV